MLNPCDAHFANYGFMGFLWLHSKRIYAAMSRLIGPMSPSKRIQLLSEPLILGISIASGLELRESRRGRY